MTRGVKLVQLDLDGNLIRKFDGMREAERATGIDRASISRCCRKVQHSAGGFLWMRNEVNMAKRNSDEDIRW